jgi:hypothetical protein
MIGQKLSVWISKITAIGVSRFIRASTAKRAPFSLVSEDGLKDPGHACLEDRVSGVDLWKRLALEDKVIVNPFTKQAQAVKVVAVLLDLFRA